MEQKCITEYFEKVNKNDTIEQGDIICVNDNGLAKKVDCIDDLTKIIGVCFKDDGDNIQIGIAGSLYVKTNDKNIRAGDLLVTEIDSCAKVKTAYEDDIDIIGMALRKSEDGKVWMKIK